MGLRVNPPPFKLSAYTNQDSENNVMLPTHAYKAQSNGYVSAIGEILPTSGFIKLYVGLTDDPVGAGNLISRVTSVLPEGIETMSVSALVAKNEYFEIVSSSATPAIWWKSEGVLRKPIDFD